MDNPAYDPLPQPSIWDRIKSPNYSRTLGVLSFLVIAAALPAFLYVAQTRQTFEQQAATDDSTPTKCDLIIKSQDITTGTAEFDATFRVNNQPQSDFDVAFVPNKLDTTPQADGTAPVQGWMKYSDWIKGSNKHIYGPITTGTDAQGDPIVTSTGPWDALLSVKANDGTFASCTTRVFAERDVRDIVNPWQGRSDCQGKVTGLIRIADESYTYKKHSDRKNGLVDRTVNYTYSGAKVQLYKDENGQPSGGVLKEVTSGSNGRYTITGLPAGRYIVKLVVPDGYEEAPGKTIQKDFEIDSCDDQDNAGLDIVCKDGQGQCDRGAGNTQKQSLTADYDDPDTDRQGAPINSGTGGSPTYEAPKSLITPGPRSSAAARAASENVGGANGQQAAPVQIPPAQFALGRLMTPEESEQLTQMIQEFNASLQPEVALEIDVARLQTKFVDCFRNYLINLTMPPGCEKFDYVGDGKDEPNGKLEIEDLNVIHRYFLHDFIQ